MRNAVLILAATLALGACHSKADTQADALDNAATQADPAAADAMRNAADQIRDEGSDANLADPNSPAQAAMANAGAAAADSTTTTDNHFAGEHMLSNGTEPASGPGSAANGAGAKPHKAGEPVPNAHK